MSNKRSDVVVIFDRKRGMFHFTSGPLRTSNSGRELWFPQARMDIFQSVEHVLVNNGIANHCVHLEELRRCGESTDYRITYSPALS